MSHKRKGPRKRKHTKWAIKVPGKTGDTAPSEWIADHGYPTESKARRHVFYNRAHAFEEARNWPGGKVVGI